MIWWLAAGAEAASVFFCIAQWARRRASGRYKALERADTSEAEIAAFAFVGWLLLGLVPVLGTAFLYGEAMHRRDLKREKERKELERVEEDVRKLLKS